MKKNQSCEGCGAPINPLKQKCNYCGRFHVQPDFNSTNTSRLSPKMIGLLTGWVVAAGMIGILSLKKRSYSKRKRRLSFI